MSAAPEQSIPQGGPSKNLGWLQALVNPLLGVVALASWINFTTFPAIQELFKTTQGGIIAIALTWLFVFQLTWPKIRKIKMPDLGASYGAAVRKKNKWILRGATLLAILGIAYVLWGNELATKYFPREQMAVFVNRIEGDHPDLQITERIRIKASNELADYEAAEKIKVIAADDTFHYDSDDLKKIDRQFMSRRYQKGLFAYGCYRVADSSLAGHIFLKRGLWADSLQKKITLPGIDSIRVSVSRKTELLGNFIVALVSYEQGDYLRSISMLDETLKDSNLLDYRFRHHCNQYLSLNYARLGKREKSEEAARKAAEALAARQCRLDYKDSLFTLLCDDGFQFSTRDSMYLYQNYVVIIHKLPGATYSLLKCGSRNFTRHTFTSLPDLALTIDKIQQGENSPVP